MVQLARHKVRENTCVFDAFFVILFLQSVAANERFYVHRIVVTAYEVHLSS